MWLDALFFGIVYLFFLLVIIAVLYFTAWSVLVAECRVHRIPTKGKGVVSMACALSDAVAQEKQRRGS